MVNVLITGATGYLGGDLLFNLSKDEAILSQTKIYALLRNEEQADQLKRHFGPIFHPIIFDLSNSEAIAQALVDNSISVVFFLIDSRSARWQLSFIDGLARVHEYTGLTTHLVHTSGAKGFSSHVGFPVDQPTSDNDPALVEILRRCREKKSGRPAIQKLIESNLEIIDAEAKVPGVCVYVFAPCIVYGASRGFGNRISIQTRAIVKAAKALRKVHRVDEDGPVWPVCHVEDNSELYAQLLRNMISPTKEGENSDLGHGTQGFYLAASGNVKWDDLYASMASALAERGIIDDGTVYDADEIALKGMSKALECAPEDVAMNLGGKCQFTAVHGLEIGWKPKYSSGHILQSAGEEVDLILKGI